MIYPTRRAVTVMAAGLPVALLVGVMTPGGWLAGPIWIAGVLALAALDALAAGSRTRLGVETPESIRPAVGRLGLVGLKLRFASGGRAPQAVEGSLSGEARLGLDDAPRQAGLAASEARLTFPFTPTRRGAATVDDLWVRWRGPLGLVWKQKVFNLGLETPVLTDLQGVRDEAVRLFAEHRVLADGDRLTGHHRFVDGGLSGDHHTVNRQLLAGANDDDIADLNVLDRNIDGVAGRHRNVLGGISVKTLQYLTIHYAGGFGA